MTSLGVEGSDVKQDSVSMIIMIRFLIYCPREARGLAWRFNDVAVIQSVKPGCYIIVEKKYTQIRFPMKLTKYEER